MAEFALQQMLEQYLEEENIEGSQFPYEFTESLVKSLGVRLNNFGKLDHFVYLFRLEEISF